MVDFSFSSSSLFIKITDIFIFFLKRMPDSRLNRLILSSSTDCLYERIKPVRVYRSPIRKNTEMLILFAEKFLALSIRRQVRLKNA